jgi:Calcineurin-like phosphoesterase
MLASHVKSKPKAKLPDGIRIYAVSDIHGRADLSQDVFAAIDYHLTRAGPVRALHVFLGDYIDRGPASRQVIDLLIERSSRQSHAGPQTRHSTEPDQYRYWSLRDRHSNLTDNRGRADVCNLEI